jgi:hypothetical protein
MMKKCDSSGIETKPIVAGWLMITSPFRENNIIIVTLWLNSFGFGSPSSF